MLTCFPTAIYKIVYLFTMTSTCPTLRSVFRRSCFASAKVSHISRTRDQDLLSILRHEILEHSIYFLRFPVADSYESFKRKLGNSKSLNTYCRKLVEKRKGWLNNIAKSHEIFNRFIRSVFQINNNLSPSETFTSVI